MQTGTKTTINLREELRNAPVVHKLNEFYALPGTEVLELQGLAGSSPAVYFAASEYSRNPLHLFIMNDREEAAYFLDDLHALLEEGEAEFLPSSFKRAIQFRIKDPSGSILRNNVLTRLTDTGDRLVLVTYPEALAEKVIQKSILQKNLLEIAQSEKISQSFLVDFLESYEFRRTDFVREPGEYAVRGSIVDLFSFAAKQPYRIDFFGETIDSLRSFDLDSQLSTGKLDKIKVFPDNKKMIREEQSGALVHFLEQLPENSMIWLNNTRYLIDRIQEIFSTPVVGRKEELSEDEIDLVEDTAELLGSGTRTLDLLQRFKRIELNHRAYFDPTLQIKANTVPQPIFHKNFKLLVENLRENQINGYRDILLCNNIKQVNRLSDIFEDLHADVDFEHVPLVLHKGFIDHRQKLALYTDHQIFDRYHRYKIQDRFIRKEALTIKELTGLNPGDYVVHVDHGIGQFGGLEKIQVSGKTQEATRLIYRDNDILYVSIHALHRISKYKGKDGERPRIHKLGTSTWQNVKNRTKKKVKDIARDLIALYAKRMTQEGYAFSQDTYLQHELEASFIYEDTPDQLKATRETKKDLEAKQPMDRLVCGDVGFGKTEIAIRAAFKAVSDNKQVALLVPTTVLALQHYHTFRERLKDFPCNIDYISRLKSTRRQKTSMANLASGKNDIIIGTHRLLGKDIQFKDLGLLIIDEEQKFGVAAKEKLKTMKLNIDTLTLTATPIPRTLQFSLMGARDLSVMHTPPPNRHPITTELHAFNEEIIKEAIEYEVSRNGQVFFIHNRVQNIQEVEQLVNRLCPEVKTVVAHGQMDGPKLEQIMLDYVDGLHDVLIATTIIESGLDIPNANTIIINNAQHFGLSDLHQLRGRVGRSNKKAFCYLLAPPLTLVSPEARRRLKAIEEFSELGSGFNIAMQDLDTRGAGNLLGAEQSGFIADIGFETYQRILNEAIHELREEEFSSLLNKGEEPAEKLEAVNYVRDCYMDTDLELLIPDAYIENTTERLSMYRKLDEVHDEEGLKKIGEELTDRFGPVPKPTLDLLMVVKLRWLAMRLGIEKIIMKSGSMILYFIKDQKSSYYRSGTFSHILEVIQKNPGKYRMKDSRSRLSLHLENIKTVQAAYDALSQLIDSPRGKPRGIFSSAEPIID